MSAHRQHYHQANANPARVREQRWHEYIGNIIAVVLLSVVALGSWYAHVTGRPVVTPVHSPVITSVEEARIEGYRAGAADAIAASCKLPALSEPAVVQ